MKQTKLVAINKPQLLTSECFNIFRTNLLGMDVCKLAKVLMFTSPTSDEGKMTSIVNTAISFSQAGKSVLLIEGDFRNGKLHEVFNIAQAPGLIDLLENKKSFEEVIQLVGENKKISIITSGILPENPSGILTTHILEKIINEARMKYDLILIDAPPVLAVTDASIISRVTDGVVLIVAMKETKMEALKLAKKVIEKAGAQILGVLMTKTKKNQHSIQYNRYTRSKKKAMTRMKSKSMNQQVDYSQV